MNLALRLPTLGQLEEALTLLRGAQAHYRVAFAKSCLTSSSMASTSGTCYLGAGDSNGTLAERDEAVAELQRGVRHLVTMARANPAVKSRCRMMCLARFGP